MKKVSGKTIDRFIEIAKLILRAWEDISDNWPITAVTQGFIAFNPAYGPNQTLMLPNIPV